MEFDLIVIGGGAAGFFGAINAAELNPSLKIAILERGKEVLQKVRISGGGRCNVTHACWDPNELVSYYPRGEKELRGPFHKFCTGDTVGWFEDRGIDLKIEEDGRMFPTTDNSQTIIDCFVQSAKRAGIEVKTSSNVLNLKPTTGGWMLETNKGIFHSKKVLCAPGSTQKVWSLLQSLGHQIVQPVPSLFTFNCKDVRFKDLAGLSVPKAHISINKTRLEAEGPLLVTHWGISGPAVLRLSAWGARQLHELQYKFTVSLNFTGRSDKEVGDELQIIKTEHPLKQVGNLPQFGIPKRLWQRLTGEFAATSWGSIDEKGVDALVRNLTASEFKINGKSTFKDEFVTAGGVLLKEVDFRTMESRCHKGLYFAGEVLDIDAITGGFNFQAAWTTSWLAAQAIAE